MQAGRAARGEIGNRRPGYKIKLQHVPRPICPTLSRLRQSIQIWWDGVGWNTKGHEATRKTWSQLSLNRPGPNR